MILNLQMMSFVLSEFSWPHDYAIEDYMPFGIGVAFPRCRLVFSDDVDGEIEVRFQVSDTKGVQLHIGHALLVIVPLAKRGLEPITPGLIDTTRDFPSEEKVANEIRNACKIILTHLRHVIAGDFSWVAEYFRMNPSIQ